MDHPSLRHIHRVLTVALGLGVGGCTEESPGLDPGPASCIDPQPILTADGRATGYVRCADESVDRVGPATCEPGLDRAPCASDGFGDCTADADCGAGALGRCVQGMGVCECVYTCAADGDCPAGQACVCGGVDARSPSALCVPADCTDSRRCGGDRCGVGGFDAGCGIEQTLACRGADDTCHSNDSCVSDCWAPGPVWNDPIGADRWQCGEIQEVCGRPLRIAARPRLATSDRRADWQAPLALDARQCEALATHWRAIAALEHASVASFARFSLQLMALGAPADLLADCQRAAADEVEHARMAYAIASAFAGEAVGPGPLSLDGITLDVDPAAVLREVIVEGCIGETLGAVEAAEAARTVEDPAIAAACARIAADELRHAALGWRTARWLLACHPELAPMVSAAFSDGIRHHTEGITPSPTPVGTHGIAVRPALRRAAWRDIIAPLAEQLLSA